MTESVYDCSRYQNLRSVYMIADYNRMQQELNGEYNLFMLKISKNAKEIREDYSKLSNENQRRFMQEIQALLRVSSVADMLNEVANWRPNR